MRLSKYAFFCLIVLSVGCASNEFSQPTAKEAALQHWNNTRSAVLLSLARDQYASGSFDKCRQTLNEALRTDPENPAVQVFLARVSIEQGNLDEAQQELDNARDMNKKLAAAGNNSAPATQPSENQEPPIAAQADYYSGVIYQRWEQPEKALEYYQSASKAAPDELAYLMAKAETLVTLDRQDEALKLLQTKVVYFEHSPVIRDAVGMLLLQSHRPAEAADMFRRASILAPDDLTVREHLANALFQDKQYVEASDILERMINTDSMVKRSDLRLSLAECQFALGRSIIARISAQDACDIDPSSPYAWVTLAKICLHLNDLHRADAALSKAENLDPENSEAQLLTGYLRLRQDRLQDALDSFAQASQLNPDDATSLCMMGYTLEKLGRDHEAADYLTQALKLDPKDNLAGKLMADVNGR